MFSSNFLLFIWASLLFGHGPLRSFAFTNSASNNLAVYWGQNSYGATHTDDTANWQKTLSYYCGDDTIDAIPMAFVNVFFDAGGLPSLDLANICGVSTNTPFAGTDLPDCSFLASDIETCQAKGKIVTISLGGGAGSYGFTSDAQATTFADTIWDLFLGGNSTTRPFGTAILDGVDLDIEGGGSTGYVAFVTQLRTYMNAASKNYYITGAPQCPFPDAYLGSVINAVGFDAIYVQFYNNYCGLTTFRNPNDWNFDEWDSWAKGTSPNPAVKVYIGAPASGTAGKLDVVVIEFRAHSFGSGEWLCRCGYTGNHYFRYSESILFLRRRDALDASQAYANDRYDQAVKSALGDGSGSPPPTSTAPTSTPTQKPTSSSTSAPAASSTIGTGSCGSVAAWMANVAYPGGSLVTYNGSLWKNAYWSEADVPGGASGGWTNEGPCAAAATIAASLVTPRPMITSVPSPVSEAKKKSSRFFKLD